MTDPASCDRSRTSALSLLADGNGVESVAHVLGVPIDVIAGWQRGEEVAWSADQTATQHDAPSTGPRPRIYEADVVHAETADARRLTLVVGLFIVGLAVTLGCALALQYRIDGLAILSLGCLPLIWVGFSVAAQARVRFVFGPSEMAAHGAWSTQRLAYADVARTTITTDSVSGGKGMRIPGLRVKIAPRLSDAPPLSLFIADTGPRPVDVINRVRALPGVTASELALFDRPRPPVREPSLIVTAVAIVVTLFGCCWFLKQSGTGWGGVLHGLPKLEQLERLDGDLTRSSGCLPRMPFTQDVTLNVGSGVMVTRSIPCLLDVNTLADGHPHRMTIYDDVGGPAYQVEMDGRPLLRYGTAKAQNFAWRAFRALIALMLTLVPVFQIRSFWRRFADTRD